MLVLPQLLTTLLSLCNWSIHPSHSHHNPSSIFSILIQYGLSCFHVRYLLFVFHTLRLIVLPPCQPFMFFPLSCVVLSSYCTYVCCLICLSLYFYVTYNILLCIIALLSDCIVNHRGDQSKYEPSSLWSSLHYSICINVIILYLSCLMDK